MQVFKHIRYLAIVSLSAIIFSACRKEAVPVQATATAVITTTVNHQGQILTPFGYKDSSSIHLISNGHYLSLRNGRIRELEMKTDKLIADFGAATTSIQNLKISNPAGAADGATIPAVDGWIAWAGWRNPNSVSPITYVSTNWTVPNLPINWAGQTIYLFNALETLGANNILQPVLQYGYSAAGGGPFWGVASWYIATNRQIFVTGLQQVSPGTNLQGVMELENSHPDGTYSYYAYFSGTTYYNELLVDGLPAPNYAYETLESYNVTDPASMYPPDNKVSMLYINIQQDDGHQAGIWFNGQAVDGSAQQTRFGRYSTSNGEVDIFFH